MRIELIISILICHAFLCQLVFAQADRGVGNRPVAEKRIALVIGNGSYQNTSPLPNPPNDAASMKSALEALKFEVIYGVNLSKSQMKTLIRQFGGRLNETKAVGLVFYAGHGLAANGENYLVPVDADIPQADEIGGATIPLSFLMAELDSAKNPLNIVILDACRNNPFERSWGGMRDISGGGGLAAIKQAPNGTLIAFATAPGSTASDGTGKNGLYTQELLVQINEPNVPIEDVFKNVRSSVRRKSNGAQVPWESSSLDGDFYFSGGAVRPVTAPVIDNSRSAEDVMWDTAARLKTRTAVDGYLSEYPKGKYAPTAKIMLKVFDDEDSKKAKRSEEQKLEEAEQKWNEAERLNTVESYRNYLSLYPDGAHKETADQRIANLPMEAEQPQPGKAVTNSLGMEFMGVPSGTFMMGDSENGPIHRVSLNRGFWMGRTEVTQAQWKAVMGSNPSRYGKCNNCPVENVTWDEVQNFIRRLNTRGDGTYRLPTEAEWEYACRAGSTARYSFGDDEGSLGNYAWYSANSGGKAQPVATRQANAWGLYDMHGNVLEWVSDWAGDYSDRSATNPRGAATGNFRVYRGGSYFTADDLRSAFRSGAVPDFNKSYLGFRLIWMK